MGMGCGCGGTEVIYGGGGWILTGTPRTSLKVILEVMRDTRRGRRIVMSKLWQGWGNPVLGSPFLRVESK